MSRQYTDCSYAAKRCSEQQEVGRRQRVMFLLFADDKSERPCLLNPPVSTDTFLGVSVDTASESEAARFQSFPSRCFMFSASCTTGIRVSTRDTERHPSRHIF